MSPITGGVFASASTLALMVPITDPKELDTTSEAKYVKFDVCAVASELSSTKVSSPEAMSVTSISCPTIMSVPVN